MNDTADWHGAVARIIECVHEPELPHALLAAIRSKVAFSGGVILAFRPDDQPLMLYEEIEESDALRYLDGPYLLDPFYRAFAAVSPPGLFRLRELAPDRFRQSRYYQTYYKRLAIIDEVGYLFGADEGVNLHVSLGRGAGEPAFSERDMGALRGIEPIVESTARCCWRALRVKTAPGTETARFHAKLRAAFDCFAISVLTSREQEIVRLMLQGHSAKSAARELDLSPATIMSHRKNVYAKLGIASHSELFSLFIGVLPYADAGSGWDPLAAYFADGQGKTNA